MPHGGNSHQRRKTRRWEASRIGTWHVRAEQLFGYVPRSATEVAILEGRAWGAMAADAFEIRYVNRVPINWREGATVGAFEEATLSAMADDPHLFVKTVLAEKEDEKLAQSIRQLRRLLDLSRDVSSSPADVELRRLAQEGVTSEIARRVTEIRDWKRAQKKETDR